MAEQSLRITVDIFADPDLFDQDIDNMHKQIGSPFSSHDREGLITVPDLTDEIERLIDKYANIERQSHCLFERKEKRDKEKE